MTVLAPQQVQDRAAIETALSKVGARGLHQPERRVAAGREPREGPAGQGAHQPGAPADGRAGQRGHHPAGRDPRQGEGGDGRRGSPPRRSGSAANFNEDLLIGMAGAGEGHFYLIQSPDDAEGVFGIEMEGLASVAGQNLVVTIEPAPTVKVASVLNRYRFEARGQQVEVGLGEVYSTEDSAAGGGALGGAGRGDGERPAGDAGLQVSDAGGRRAEGVLRRAAGDGDAGLGGGGQRPVGGQERAGADEPASHRPGEGPGGELADSGDVKGASQQLRSTIAELSANLDKGSFELVEEVEQLEHYAKRLESRSTTRRSARSCAISRTRPARATGTIRPCAARRAAPRTSWRRSPAPRAASS